MNSISLKKIMLILTMFSTFPITCKRPRKEKPPKQPRPTLTHEQKQVIAANVAQVMGGICTIAQDPRNPHNLGSSIGSIIQALITIIIEKFSRRSYFAKTSEDWQQYVNELTQEIKREITKIMKKNKHLDIGK